MFDWMLKQLVCQISIFFVILFNYLLLFIKIFILNFRTSQLV
ncbi:hypothetical protein D1BOALGB6SA_4348 [Olavius sp. associated proteobacterium Delta 1]|nr:hypothetical protein D1BOALGB6SA_4348 [Olavius sp. associated proteobacterium Delta 1]